MRDDTISLRQMGAVLFLALFALGTELLPERLAASGGAGWLCPLLAGAIAVGLGALLLWRGHPRRLAERLCRHGWAGRAAVWAFLLWGVVLTAAHAGRIGGRLSDSLHASPVWLSAAALLLAGWMAAGGLPAFARACEIFALAVGTAFALIVLFGAFRLRWDLVLLWRREELAQVPGGAVSTLGAVAAGGYALFLAGDVAREEGWERRLLRRMGWLFGLLGAAMLLVLGRLGAALTGQIDRAFFQMVSGLGFQGAFQRLEELASALWILGDVALLGLLLLCLRRLLANGLGRAERPAQGWILTGAVFLLSMDAAFWDRVLAGQLLPVGNLIAGALMAACLFVPGEETKKEKKFSKKA